MEGKNNTALHEVQSVSQVSVTAQIPNTQVGQELMSQINAQVAHYSIGADTRHHR